MVAQATRSDGIYCKIPDSGVIELKGRALYVINVGSVGQPRDDDPRASYGLFDSDKLLFQIRRVSYDIDKAQARIREAGLPERNADRLSTGS